MGKRVLFTKREIEKYSKTHEGRQYMNTTHKNIGISCIVIGSIVLVLCLILFFSLDDSIAFISCYPLILSIFLLLFGVIKFLIYNTAYKEENLSEQLREKNRKEQINLLKRAHFEQIDNMKGLEFEEFCTVILSDLGYNATQTKKSGDFGADILLEKNGERIVVQIKRYSKKVSVSAVQEIVAAKKYYNSFEAWIITNNYFTSSAQELALTNDVKLIDRDALARMINKTVTPISNLQNSCSLKKNNYDPLKYSKWFSDQIIKKQETAFNLYNQKDYEGIYRIVLEAQQIIVKEKQNLISLHFFYNKIASWLHSLASFNYAADDLALKVCEQDFEIFPTLKFEKSLSCPTATIYCIILTRKKEYQAALSYCDFFIENKMNETSGRSFENRKNRLQKMILLNEKKY